MKKVYILAIFCFSAFAFDPLYTTDTTSSPFEGCKNVAQGLQINLTQALDIALCSDPKTKQAYASAMQLAANLGVSRSAYLPNANAALKQPFFSDPSGQSNLNGSAGVNLSLLVYDFGQTNSAVENAKKLLEAANFTQAFAVQSIFLKTIQDYCAVLAANEALDAAKISEDFAKESYKSADAKFSAGAIAVADKLQAETAWSQAVLARVNSEGNLTLARATFASDLSNEVGLDYQLAPLATPNASLNFTDSIKELINEALAKRPDLKSTKAQVEAAKASVAQNQSAYMPTISIGGQLGYKDQYLFPPPNNSLIAVNINVPIFNGFATHYKIRSAKAQLDVQEGVYEGAVKQVILSVYQYYNTLLTKTKAIQTTQTLLTSAMQSEKVARGRYDAGVGTMIDLLNAQSALQSARVQKIQAELDWRIAKAGLAYAMGSLSVDGVQKEMQKEGQ